MGSFLTDALQYNRYYSHPILVTTPSSVLTQANSISSHSSPGSCLLCGEALRESENSLFDTRFGIPQMYCIGLCLHCGLEQLSEPPLSELEDLYARFYNFGGESNSFYFRLRERFFRSSLYYLWTLIDGDISFHSRKGSGRLLDVGCNEGRGLEQYLRNGYQPVGLELNPVAAAQARLRGFEVSSTLLEDFESEPFDVIVMSNVLEHVPDPKAALRAASRLLAPSGQLWISCPNSESWLRQLFGGSWVNWHIPFHLSFFSQQSLSTALETVDFHVREARTETPSVWFAFSVICAFFARRGRLTRELRSPFLVAGITVLARLVLFPVFWIFNMAGKGDCLIVLASRAAAPNHSA
jgi:SAM-dependent methyltransferase